MEAIDKLAVEFNDVGMARVAVAEQFMREALRMGNDLLLQVTAERAWPAENEPALIVKFSSKLDVDIVDSFKKNLGPNQNVSDVVPPCLFQVEKFLKTKGGEARHPGPGKTAMKTRIV